MVSELEYAHIRLLGTGMGPLKLCRNPVGLQGKSYFEVGGVAATPARLGN